MLLSVALLRFSESSCWKQNMWMELQARGKCNGTPGAPYLPMAAHPPPRAQPYLPTAPDDSWLQLFHVTPTGPLPAPQVAGNHGCPRRHQTWSHLCPGTPAHTYKCHLWHTSASCGRSQVVHSCSQVVEPGVVGQQLLLPVHCCAQPQPPCQHHCRDGWSSQVVEPGVVDPSSASLLACPPLLTCC